MNELFVCVCVSVRPCVLIFRVVYWYMTCPRAWMHTLRMSSPVQLFKHILCSNSSRITHRSLHLNVGELYGGGGGPPPPDLIAFPCSERRNASTQRSGYFLSCSDGSKNVFWILYLFCSFHQLPSVKPLKNVAWHDTFAFNVGILTWAWSCPDVLKSHA